MKFAKELEQELVPEWRAKYLDYKAGKKKLKAITRAIQKSNRNPSYPSLRRATIGHDDPSFASPSGPDRAASDRRTDATDSIHNPSTPARSGALPTPRPRNERQPLRNPGSRFSAAVGSYGSIIATPPHHPGSSDVASLELPDPALDPKEHEFMSEGEDRHLHALRSPSPVMSRHASTRTVPTEASNASPLARQSTAGKGRRRNTVSSPSAKRTSQLLKRVFSQPDADSPEKRAQETQQQSEIERRQDEFFAFLDDEFDKIESFYQMKEKEATQRLHVLREQLHVMRDQRIQEVLGTKSSRAPDGDTGPSNGFAGLNGSRLKDAFTGRRIGKNSKALAEMATPGLQAQDQNVAQGRRDFSRRPDDQSNLEVPYRVAKRKLKYALQEFYRGIELLKAYAYLNRTAFRKINKKYDKVAHARPTMRYMSEKVNKAWFVQSEVIENLMSATEDLYARYFERGNRKLAASKLRHTVSKSGDYSPNTFCSGILLMAGILFAIQSLVYAAQHLHHSDPDVQVHTSYLMQIYGGYFLVVFHFLLFCVDCFVWTKTKINYVFVFEYDTRHALDWRQLSELPCFFMFILGLFMWLNFLSVNAMYVYWPVVLVAVTVIVLFLPARVLYHRSRKWWAYSNWRLALAGFYPVEFRDFFLGDMYCSQTYAMGNISLFFCLYAKHWTNASQCNSSHSRLLGFFTTIPSILRALQCIRRYADTKNVFPHLLNFGKYMFGVLYYATLSMYRIDKITRFEAPFITFALLNAVYTSVWDLAMDWSLGNPYAKHPLLRDALAFRKAWVYYAAMAIDVIVRFNWIFYAIFAGDIQHSAVLSFAVSFSEICRRGVWTIFRVENEHCTNVLLFRASRDVPLPYELASPQAEADQTADMPLHETDTSTAQSAPADVEHGTPSTPGASMRARGISRVGTILASAHAQDFERRKRPDQLAVASVPRGAGEIGDDSSDDDDYPADSRPYTHANDVIDEEGPSRGSPRTSSERG
ncbi:SPX and EXS domain-containing protein [Aspergillus melleus]|uniref:SPX and EXS domain-containing protein n=1 Tax=Aspergillus melleus TaxID=138277 RepID=UPI001E8E92A2|nr:Xenotropic and polytropic retrovirus receptor 1 [Aspergillus melleus]KAH8423548.1 Xenotropic and polytropic retrovirus receptor 1 [Aspergillus melleus]